MQFEQTPKAVKFEQITPKALKFEQVTPKAFANLSPGFERSENPGKQINKKESTLKGLGMCGNNPFRVTEKYCRDVPRVVAALQPWAEISERLRRCSISK